MGYMCYMLMNADQLIWTDPLEIFKVWEGGMSFHGGFLGVLRGHRLFARQKKIDMLKLGDLVAPVGARSACSSAASPTSSTASCGAGHRPRSA
jgi:prolipoprotein diacylglyceryltransferase